MVRIGHEELLASVVGRASYNRIRHGVQVQFAETALSQGYGDTYDLIVTEYLTK